MITLLLDVLAMVGLLVPPAIVVGGISDACFDSDIPAPVFADVRTAQAVDAPLIGQLMLARSLVQL